MMDPQRKRDLLEAEARFVRRERLRRRLAEAGVYLLGPVTCPDSPQWESLKPHALEYQKMEKSLEEETENNRDLLATVRSLTTPMEQQIAPSKP